MDENKVSSVTSGPSPAYFDNQNVDFFVPLLVSVNSLYFSNIDCFCVKQTVFKLLPLRFGGKSMRVFGERSRFLSCDCSRGIKEPLCPYK